MKNQVSKRRTRRDVEYDYSQIMPEAVVSLNNVKVTRYANSMNEKEEFSGFSVREMRLFMLIIAGMYEQEDRTVRFSAEEIKRRLFDNTHLTNEEFEKMIVHIFQKIGSPVVTYKAEDGTTAFFMFNELHIDKDATTVTVKINPGFCDFLNKLGARNYYTEIELKKFNKLDSRYSQTLYRLLRQWWYSDDESCWIDASLLRRVFSQKDAETKIFNRNCLIPAIKEISEKAKEFKYLRLDKEKMRQKPIEKYYFRWDKPDAEDLVEG